MTTQLSVSVISPIKRNELQTKLKFIINVDFRWIYHGRSTTKWFLDPCNPIGSTMYFNYSSFTVDNGGGPLLRVIHLLSFHIFSRVVVLVVRGLQKGDGPNVP